MTERTILHVDMDAFYAAVEQRDNPVLRGRPVIVGADPKGGRGRGIVATCSYEARRFGVHSAQPISQAWRLCPQGVYLQPEMAKYERVSDRIMSIFVEFTDAVEQVSIDEAFLDVTGSRRLHGSGREIAGGVKSRILKDTGLTASVGVGCNKFVAKVASDLQKPDGLVVVEPGNEREFLRPLAVERLRGVGAKTRRLLANLGIETIGDLAEMEPDKLGRQLGRIGEHLWLLSRGIDESPVSPEEGYKSIGHESTFDRDTADAGALHDLLLDLTERVAQRLRSNGVRARTITVKFREADFTTHTRRRTLGVPADTSERIFPVAQELFHSVMREGCRVRLIGVYGSNLTKEDPARQLGLFEGGHRKEKDLAEAMDSIVRRYGKSAITRATLVPHPGGRTENGAPDEPGPDVKKRKRK